MRAWGFVRVQVPQQHGGDYVVVCVYRLGGGGGGGVKGFGGGMGWGLGWSSLTVSPVNRASLLLLLLLSNASTWLLLGRSLFYTPSLSVSFDLFLLPFTPFG